MNGARQKRNICPRCKGVVDVQGHNKVVIQAVLYHRVCPVTKDQKTTVRRYLNG